jgi:hypothetical protein
MYPDPAKSFRSLWIRIHNTDFISEWDWTWGRWSWRHWQWAASSQTGRSPTHVTRTWSKNFRYFNLTWAWKITYVCAAVISPAVTVAKKLFIKKKLIVATAVQKSLLGYGIIRWQCSRNITLKWGFQNSRHWGLASFSFLFISFINKYLCTYSTGITESDKKKTTSSESYPENFSCTYSRCCDAASFFLCGSGFYSTFGQVKIFFFTAES